MKNDKVIQNLYQIQEFIGSGLYNIIEDDDEGCLDGINDELYDTCEKAVKILTAAKELLKSIDENHMDLWDADLEDTHSSVIFSSADVTCYGSNHEEYKQEFKGISNSYSKLKKLIEE